MLVCDVTSRDCMLHKCDECPFKDKIRDILDTLFIENDFFEDDLVTYKQRMKKEKYTNLVTLQLAVNDYIEEICCQYDELELIISSVRLKHHFCATSRKLSENECIIFLDFAENYSDLVQDGVQGFHWNNSQATLHPFVIYFKK